MDFERLSSISLVLLFERKYYGNESVAIARNSTHKKERGATTVEKRSKSKVGEQGRISSGFEAIRGFIREESQRGYLRNIK